MDQPRGDRGKGWDWSQLADAALRESRRVLGEGQDAEDAAQEAMIRAFKWRGRCVNQHAPEAWIRAIARREAYRQSTARMSEQPILPTAERPDDGTTNAIDASLAARELLSRVPAADRSLLLRRYLLDQSSVEIAAALAIPPATVRVRLHRAVKRLRQCEPGWV
ncbi:MAG TPA: sigma-70 family RNA polymerase sigma factor [Solirubrobacteraceae bacterium]|nr:sigma-70 family RNA polymerase sigma factor [Solirubrobacteraceae bacterium]